MKTLRIFLLFCLVALRSTAADGIIFFEGSWTAALEAAGKQQKLIFVDVYTDWCPPCKQMDKEVLPLTEVGNKYNPSFLSFKLNAEKGEGVALAKKYGVTAYPTYLYLDSKGRLVHRVSGYNDPAALNEHADRALRIATDRNYLGNLEDRYLQGDRNKAFVQSYIEKMTGLGIDNSEVLNQYFNSLTAKERASTEALTFLGRNVSHINTPALQYFMAHYGTLHQPQLAPRLYADVFRRNVLSALEEKRYHEVEPMLAFAEQLNLPERKTDMLRIQLMYYKSIKDAARLKITGHKIADELMEIPVDTIQATDARRYQELMQPFLSGQQDSTKIPGFAEEKKIIMHVYAREIGAKIYEVATAYLAVLPPGDPGFNDALRWARRAMEVNSGEKVYTDLINKLKNSSSKQP